MTDILWRVMLFVGSYIVFDGMINNFEVTLKCYANIKLWIWRQLS